MCVAEVYGFYIISRRAAEAMCSETMLGFQIRHGSRHAPCSRKVATECAERQYSSEDGGINRSDQMHLVVKRAFSRLTENQI